MWRNHEKLEFYGFFSPKDRRTWTNLTPPFDLMNPICTSKMQILHNCGLTGFLSVDWKHLVLSVSKYLWNILSTNPVPWMMDGRAKCAAVPKCAVFSFVVERRLDWPVMQDKKLIPRYTFNLIWCGSWSCLLILDEAKSNCSVHVGVQYPNIYPDNSAAALCKVSVKGSSFFSCLFFL